MQLRLFLASVLFMIASCAGLSGKGSDIVPDSEQIERKANRAEAFNHFIAGEIYAGKGQFNKAIAEYRKVSDLDPKASTVHTKLVHAYLLLDDTENALIVCKRALECSPDSTQLWATLGRIQLRLNQYDEAEDTFQQVIKMAPDNSSAYAVLISIYESLNDLIGTIEAYEKMLELQPDSALLHFRYAVNLAHLSDSEGCRNAASRALELEPTYSQAHYLIALSCLDMNEPERAIKELSQYLEEAPDDARARESLGGAFARIRNYDQALEQFEMILGTRDENESAEGLTPGGEDATKYKLEQTLLLLMSGQYVAAKENAVPENAPIFGAMLNALARKGSGGDYISAIKMLDDIDGDIDAECTQFLNGIISTFGKDVGTAFLLKNLEELEELKIFSRNLAIIHARALILLDRDKEAEPILVNALKRHGSDRWVHFILSTIYEKLNDLSKTMEHLKASISFAPEDPDLLNFLGYLYADKNMKLDEAEQLLTRALDIKPDSPYYLDSMGWLLYRQGNADKAIDYIRRAIMKMESDDAILRDHLGDAYLLKGETERATEEWRRARRLDPKLKGVQEKLDKYLK